MSGWSHGLFGCFNPLTTCCLATWVPCILYGQTQARREGDLDNSGCNSSCMGCFALSLCYLQGIPQTITRGKMRRQYGIEGNCCGDCLISFCCGCCTLVQEDKEVKTQEKKENHAAPQQQTPMAYSQPQ